jgi:site-specific DNA-methyltransferase (adenine-specific)
MAKKPRTVARNARKTTAKPNVDGGAETVAAAVSAPVQSSATAKNRLYYGDNLDVLRRHIADESVDLIYLDPPFNSNADYNVLFAEHDGTPAHAQFKAFEDTWTWDTEAAANFQDAVQNGGQEVAKAMMAFRTLLGTSDMLAYLSNMAPRLLELRRVLKPTGSIYMHCDPTASHYLKLLMDAIFRPHNFRNEIIWHYYNKFQRGDIKMFASGHDSLLFFTKQPGTAHTFGSIHEQRDKPFKQLRRKWESKTQRIVNARGPDGELMYEIKTERKVDDVWRLPYIVPASKEGLGYPTQKPETLLDRVIQASSEEGDLVLDPFCGCGTAIAVAQRLKRRWIGIDVTHLAINLIKVRLFNAFGPKIEKTYEVIGEPVSNEDAKQLAEEDPFQFQCWALGLVDARPVQVKKGADKGVDGRLFFHDGSEKDETKQVIISVKGGENVSAKDVRDLCGVINREKAAIGVLITMTPPTKPMKTEAASAGFYKSPGHTQHPRLQILTITDLLNGGKINMPMWRDVRTFKKAPKARGAVTADRELFGDAGSNDG